jgi:hypothetical protein
MKDLTATFSNKYGALIAASVLALLVAGLTVYKIEAQKKTFDVKVGAALQISDGYDEQFIAMVHRLEDELAERASFGYAGRRDPMTGTVRAVAVRQPPPPRVAAPRRTPAAAAAAPAAVAEVAVAPVVPVVDPVRLTAIIYDNTLRTFTAIVMDGGRSLSVVVGDRVAGRAVTRITKDEIHMESATERFIYNIMGGNTRVAK